MSQLCSEWRKNAYMRVCLRYLQTSKTNTCDLRSRLKVAAVISHWEVKNLSMRMRQDTSQPKGRYKNPEALWDRVILSTCVWPFVYLRPIRKDLSPHTNTEQNRERSPTCSLKAIPSPPSPANHSGQLWAEGQESFLLTSLGTSPPSSGLTGIGSISHSWSLLVCFFCCRSLPSGRKTTDSALQGMKTSFPQGCY